MSMEKVLQIALNEVGYLEKASNYNLDSKTANAGANNYTKYARDFDSLYPNFYNGKKNGCEWCDMFVDWCVVQVYGEEGARTVLCQPAKSAGAGCYYSAAYYKTAGRFGTTPQKGAQIFFQRSGDVTHTGLVYAVDDKYVYTVEGNTSNASGVVSNGGGVAKKSYARGSSYIYGYGYPKYDAVKALEKEGWQQDDKGWWYRNADGTYPKSEWMALNGTWYYFGPDGYMLAGDHEYDGYIWHFSKSGAYQGKEKIESEETNMNVDELKDLIRQTVQEMQAETAAKPGSDWSQADRDWAIENGIFQGDEHGDMHWQAPITREQVAAVLHRVSQ